jgi:predicted DNA-binding antitoxin AbrB/MazE fold protein
MQALKARVENGRLKLDEPTDLPEGELVELVPLGEVLLNGGDDLDDEERAALHESIREGIADLEAGRTVDAKTAIAKLRSRL